MRAKKDKVDKVRLDSNLHSKITKPIIEGKIDNLAKNKFRREARMVKKKFLLIKYVWVQIPLQAYQYLF